MPDQLQLRGGTTTEHNSFTGALREVTVDTTKKTLVVHDGASAGGTALMKESGSNAASSVQLGVGGNNKLTINSDGHIDIASNLDCAAGIDVTGAITGTGDLTIDSGILHVDSTNNRVGINTTTPAGLLDLRDTSGASITVRNTGTVASIGLAVGSSTNQIVSRGANSSTARDLSFIFGTTEAMRINSSGNVGIGTTAPLTRLSVTDTNKVVASEGNVKIGANSAGADIGGQITYGNTNARRAAIAGRQEGTHAIAGYLQFGTRGTSGDITERMRIDSSGNVGIGTTSPGQNLHVKNTDHCAIQIESSRTSAADNIGALQFKGGSTDAAVIQVLVDGSIKFRNTNALHERMRIDASGRVMIGATSVSPANTYSDNLVVSEASGDAGISIHGNNSNSNYASLYLGDAGAASRAYLEAQLGSGTSTNFTIGAQGITRFLNNGAERMRIDSSGRVLIGHSTSTPMDNDANNPIFAVEGTGNGARIAVRSDDSNATNGAFIYLTRTRGTSAGSKTTVQSGDALGGFIFMGADGTHDTRAARLLAECDGTPGDNDMPGRLVFETTPDGGLNTVERMRIDSSGDIHIGRTDTLNLGANNVTGINLLASGRILASSNGSQSEFGRQGSNGEVIRFACQGTGNVGSIDVTTSSTSYNTSSDYRLKENITAISDGITRLKTLKPSRFNFKIDKDKTVDGFLAHEVTAVPEAITGTKDEVATEDNELAGVKKGDPIYQKIDQSKLIPLLVAAVQELIGKVETLEAA